MKKFLVGAVIGAAAGALGYKIYKEKELIIESLTESINKQGEVIDTLYDDIFSHSYDDFDDFEDEFYSDDSEVKNGKNEENTVKTSDENREEKTDKTSEDMDASDEEYITIQENKQ